MASRTTSFPTKPRLFILSDITNEPDDTQSLCRLLTYSNQLDLEGLVATTSVWLRNKVAPEVMHRVVDGYEKAVSNLNVHAHPDAQYLSADHVRSLIKSGASVYGMEAVGDDIPLSEGANLLLDRLQVSDPRPLWVLLWGGANVLASVVHHIRKLPNAADLRAKLRVYAISDQDDTGAWLRITYPDIFYICSVHGWNQYFNATWTGISGDMPGEEGADRSLVSNAWIKTNIQIGPLGEKYPDVEYVMEGDTPTFPYLIQNGLNSPDNPSWGSWGGRYLPIAETPTGMPKYGHHADAIDTVIGIDGKTATSNKAAIWRWRRAFQHDFAARIQWTMHSEFSKANHHPVVIVNDHSSLSPLHIDVDAGFHVELDASKTYDPDGDSLTFKWYQYKEPSAIVTHHVYEVSDLTIETLDDGRKAKVTVASAEKSCILIREKKPLAKGFPLHMILEVTDSGTPELTAYKRVVIQPINPDFRS
ncbi:hypothetical protein KVT40_000979 [Elsinoe batatas]|uniref:Cellulose-binding protein n=1 Tax=Elsinoe batatas TaxID=2601811 RepID=A0A8K0LB20_9PEZI|nr:hypothetical protein KVT40_000979 [Elsinoe batatas]